MDKVVIIKFKGNLFQAPLGSMILYPTEDTIDLSHGWRRASQLESELYRNGVILIPDLSKI